MLAPGGDDGGHNAGGAVVVKVVIGLHVIVIMG